jgi:hypothetical protein
MNARRRFAPKIFVPLFIAAMGFAPFSRMAGSPGFAAIRTIDVVRLMASGMCFGAAITALVFFFAGRRSG